MTPDVFIFQTSTGTKEHPEQLAVVYCPDSQAKDALISNLKYHFDQSIPPDGILLLGSTRCGATISQCLSDESLLRSLPLFTRTKHPPGVFGFKQDRDGRWLAQSPESGRFEKNLDGILQSGVAHIFRARGGLLRCTPSFHYRKPSGAHCDSFLRAANVLVHGAEIGFIGSQLISSSALGKNDPLALASSDPLEEQD